MPNNLYSIFFINYIPGTLKVKGYLKIGNDYFEMTNTLGRNIVCTSGKPNKLMCVANKIIKADGYDLAYVEVTIVDQNGMEVPNANNVCYFNVTGEGKLLAADNGSSPDHQE